MSEKSVDSAESGIEQPFPDSWTARFVRTLPMTSVDDVETTLDKVDVRRAFRRRQAVESADGEAVLGAVKVRPASKSMADDLEDEIRHVATTLTSEISGRAQLVDVPRKLDRSSRRDRYRALADDLALDESWSANVLADLAEEEAAVENLYQETTSTYDHYVVLRVDRLEAAQSLSSDDGGLTKVPYVGKAIKERRVDKLRHSDDLKKLMVELLETRLNRFATQLSYIEGIDANPISSAEFIEALATYYRSDVPSRIDNFRALVRQSPVPGVGTDDTEPTAMYGASHPTVDDDRAPETLATIAEGEERARQVQSLVAPREIRPESDGHIQVGNRAAATLSVTGLPEVPPQAYLEPLYQYDRPEVEITVATHIERIEEETARKQAKNQENSLSDKQESKIGSVLEETLEAKLEQATQFTQSIEQSDYGVFDVGLFVTVSATAGVDDSGTEVPAEEVLESTLKDLQSTILKEQCGIDTNRLDGMQMQGWRTTAPAAENYFDTNVKMLANGIARQFPYQYRNLKEETGIRLGLHEYLREPLYLDVFGRENGYNGGVYGMIGSGKTTTLQDIATKLYLQHELDDEPFKMVLSTPLQDFEGLCEALGGKHIVVGGDTAINPLEIRHVPASKLKIVGLQTPWKDMLDRAMAFLESYYDMEGLAGWGSKKGTWERAIKAAQTRQGIEPGEPGTYENESATLRDAISVLEQIVEAPDAFETDALTGDEETREKRREQARQIIAHDIEPFRANGRFEHFTRTSDVDLKRHDVVYLDFQRYESDKRAGGLEMQMRLSDLYEQAKSFEGETFFAVDEFNYMLRNPRAKQFFKQTHRASRHWDLAVWLATQEINDLFVENDDGLGLTDSARVIFNNQAMQLYHYTKEMNDRWGDVLDLSQRSQHFVDDAQVGKKEEGYSQALLVVDEDEYPLRVEMSDHMNPRQFSIYQYDPTKADHSDDFREFLRQYGDRADVCNWRWD
ncbi:transfer complex protein [Halobacteria archaeon HArc-gm2]|nr:transfer complex protein [Halobacteria archaeon HArc-gm2]